MRKRSYLHTGLPFDDSSIHPFNTYEKRATPLANSLRLNRSYKSPPSHKSQAQKNRPIGRFFMQRLGLGARRERWLTEAKISEQTECSWPT